ncbi:DUF2851 family protein [Chryseobacterium sp.]|uniref:DUF2851 family protein n=1 Tax=Chryseobacterium sp. TaxID=1871047 RepID=UPI0011C98E19|nr:DUF2851 family protein [Chryseobacterium sp.]TXF76331.1 DUF2851 family protein [Chryseobacterium sp.]
MNEKLLQYLWNFKIFKNFDFRDTAGNEIEILDFGKWNYDSGPDFLFGKIKVHDVVLAGNIELHVKSSDWIFHRHSGNPEFENLILHVVFQDDTEIEELKNKNIPTLELSDYIDDSLLWKYESLLKENSFIPCEKIFNPDKIPFYFAEESLLKKLDLKSIEIEADLAQFKNNYEAVLFHRLAYAFGLKVNAFIFKQMAESIDFSVLNRIRQNRVQLESLFFGICGWLDAPEDEYMNIWKREFDFLKTKFQLPDLRFTPKFSKLRPPNFPTVRLSQLAALYHSDQNLFSKIISARKAEELYELFKNVKASEYWDNRFSFGKISTVTGEKFLTEDFIDLVFINAVLPLKYTFHKNNQENNSDEILSFYSRIGAEKNSVTEGWKSLKVPMRNALDSQAYIFHHKHFCTLKNCLNCGIGFQLLKNS